MHQDYNVIINPAHETHKTNYIQGQSKTYKALQESTTDQTGVSICLTLARWLHHVQHLIIAHSFIEERELLLPEVWQYSTRSNMQECTIIVHYNRTEL